MQNLIKTNEFIRFSLPFTARCFIYFQLSLQSLAALCGCFSRGFVLRNNPKSANSLRIGPRPKRISDDYALAKAVKIKPRSMLSDLESWLKADCSGMPVY